MKLTKSAGWTAALYLPLLVYVTWKLKYMPPSLKPFLSTVAYAIDWKQRFLACTATLIIWGVLWTFFFKALARLKWQIPPILLFYSFCGLATFITLATSVDAFLLLPLLATAAGAGYLYIRGSPAPQIEAPPARQHWITTAVLSLIVLGGVLKLAAAFLWLPLLKPAATGDELYFWWSATDYLAHTGVSEYVKNFPVSHYGPAYPFISTILLGFWPRSLVALAEPVLPFFFGFFLFAILLFSRPSEPIKLSWIAGTFYVFNFLVFSHLWIYGFSFERWYGEAMAMGLVAAIFLAIDPAMFKPDNRSIEILTLFGLGVISRLSKPPLELLLIPAVIPCLAVWTWIANRQSPSMRQILYRLVMLAAGALLAQVLWRHILTGAGKNTFYGFSLSDVRGFSVRPAFLNLTRYFFMRYKQVWLAFLWCAGAACWINPRRYLPSLAASSALVLSIFVLYATAWKNGDFESGARYILHGSYGWILYFLACEGPSFLNCLMQKIEVA